MLKTNFINLTIPYKYINELEYKAIFLSNDRYLKQKAIIFLTGKH